MTSWYDRVSNPRLHPRLAFVTEYVEGLATIVTVYALTRLAYGIMLWIDRVLPTHPPNEAHWYLPISFSRSLVTIVDTVALLFVAVISIVGVVRLIAQLAKGKASEKEAA
jgi:hypothetical protein